ncbi:Inner membrane protein YedI [compost metagenome]
MAGSSLLALLDDIASILDDVSLMTKVAAKKTAGVLGDDLALNAQQVAGVRAERELPVVWAVAVGSLKNKAILVPAALAISAFAPWAITPLLMVGGAYLCFEGFEKIAHKYLHPDDSHKAELAQALRDPQVDLVALEKDKIKGAIRTDFILSAEIIVIALGTVAAATFAEQVAVVVGIALLMTVGVYGLVAGIVKLDDAGFYLAARKGAGALMDGVRGFGRMLVSAAPKLMKFLSVVGTLAMFMVGGGILTHGWPWASGMLHHAEAAVGGVASIGPVLAAVTPSLINAVAGLIAGGLVLAGVTAVSALLRMVKSSK